MDTLSTTDETESRGWETSSDYEEHWMDDLDYDVADDTEPDNVVNKVGLGIVLGIFIMGIAYWCGQHWQPVPPAVVFPAPVIRLLTFEPSGGDWTGDCLDINYSTKRVQPNYGNPDCQAKFKTYWDAARITNLKIYNNKLYVWKTK